MLTTVFDLNQYLPKLKTFYSNQQIVQKHQYGFFRIDDQFYIEHEIETNAHLPPIDFIASREEPTTVHLYGRTGSGKTCWAKEQMRLWGADKLPPQKPWFFYINLERLNTHHIYLSGKEYSGWDIIYNECLNQVAHYEYGNIINGLKKLFTEQPGSILLIIDGIGSHEPSANLKSGLQELMSHHVSKILLGKKNSKAWQETVSPEATYNILGFKNNPEASKQFLLLFFEELKRDSWHSDIEGTRQVFENALPPVNHPALNCPLSIDIYCTQLYDGEIKSSTTAGEVVHAISWRFVTHYLYDYFKKMNNPLMRADFYYLHSNPNHELYLLEYFAFMSLCALNNSFEDAIQYTQVKFEQSAESLRASQRALEIVNQDTEGLFAFEYRFLQEHLAARYLASCVQRENQTLSTSSVPLYHKEHVWTFENQLGKLTDFIRQSNSEFLWEEKLSCIFITSHERDLTIKIQDLFKPHSPEKILARSSQIGFFSYVGQLLQSSVTGVKNSSKNCSIS